MKALLNYGQGGFLNHQPWEIEMNSKGDISVKLKAMALLLLSIVLIWPILPSTAYSEAPGTYYEALHVPNGDFEASDESPIDWRVVPAMPEEGLDVRIVQDKAYTGKNSLK